MSYELDAAAEARLEAYFAQIGTSLRDKRKRASFAIYAHGLLSDGERKSVEPMAARACGDLSSLAVARKLPRGSTKYELP